MAKSSPAPVSKDLVEWLERHYPDRLPLDLPSEQEVARLVGRQDVVRKLRREYETQYES